MWVCDFCGCSCLPNAEAVGACGCRDWDCRCACTEWRWLRYPIDPDDDPLDPDDDPPDPPDDRLLDLVGSQFWR